MVVANLTSPHVNKKYLQAVMGKVMSKRKQFKTTENYLLQVVSSPPPSVTNMCDVFEVKRTAC